MPSGRWARVSRSSPIRSFFHMASPCVPADDGLFELVGLGALVSGRGLSVVVRQRLEEARVGLAEERDLDSHRHLGRTTLHDAAAVHEEGKVVRVAKRGGRFGGNGG